MKNSWVSIFPCTSGGYHSRASISVWGNIRPNGQRGLTPYHLPITLSTTILKYLPIKIILLIAIAYEEFMIGFIYFK